MVTITDRRLDLVLRAVADPTRREILHLLRRGPHTVGAISRNFRMSRPAISRHLRVLRSARLIMTHKSGTSRVCDLNGKPLRSIHNWLRDYEPFWSDTLRDLKRYVEETG